jgi:hypothetical protein
MPRRYTRKIELRDRPPENSTLLRFALPTYDEIEGEADTRERRKREREKNWAINELNKLYRDAEKRGELEQLDFSVRMFCENLKRRNDDRLPSVRGGRPPEEHRRLLVAVRVREAIEILGEDKRGSVAKALRAVARLEKCTSEAVRKIHEDRDPDWKLAVKVELAARREKMHRDPDPEWQCTIAELVAHGK